MYLSVCQYNIPFILVLVRVSEEVKLAQFEYSCWFANGGKYGETSCWGCVIAEEILSKNRDYALHLLTAPA